MWITLPERTSAVTEYGHHRQERGNEAGKGHFRRNVTSTKSPGGAEGYQGWITGFLPGRWLLKRQLQLVQMLNGQLLEPFI